MSEGKKPLSELREELEISSPTAIHALRELEKDNLVFQGEDRDYALITKEVLDKTDRHKRRFGKCAGKGRIY